jgi:hypothetical protein
VTPIPIPFSIHPVASSDLNAARQAFLAVLGSVCDAHLNTIHAVCQKWAESRSAIQGQGNDLNPPKRPDLPTPIYEQYCSVHDHTQEYGPTASIEELRAMFNSPSLPPHSIIPPLHQSGPISLPLLEPSHPIQGIEFDAFQIWDYVLTFINLGETDTEKLAAELCRAVRFYGFGPVLLEVDVKVICKGELEEVEALDCGRLTWNRRRLSPFHQDSWFRWGMIDWRRHSDLTGNRKSIACELTEEFSVDSSELTTSFQSQEDSRRYRVEWSKESLNGSW